MATPLIFIKIEENPPIGALATTRDEVFTSVYEAIGRWWAERDLPKHFMPNARYIYGYQARKSSTIRRKHKDAAKGKAIMGGEVDLVWTGNMMKAVLGLQTIRSTPKKVDVIMYGPQYLWQYNKQAGAPDKAAEITKITPAEVEELNRVAELAYQFALNKAWNKYTKTTQYGAAA